MSSSLHTLPPPTRADLSKPSLCDLPAEIRIEICNYLLEANNIPRSYGYTGPTHENKRKPQIRKHGLGFVSKMIGAEYRLAFHERTHFFLRIDSQNAFRGAPTLGSNQVMQREPNEFNNFWNAPSALLANLRHCTLYIELGDIASCPESIHSLSQVIRSSKASEAMRVREEMKAFSSYEQLKAQDKLFDREIQAAIYILIERMGQLRSVQVVWDTTVSRPSRSSVRNSRLSHRNTNLATNWEWKELGAPLVDTLLERPHLRKIQVKVGDARDDTVYKAQRVDGAKWEGGIEDTPPLDDPYGYDI